MTDAIDILPSELGRFGRLRTPADADAPILAGPVQQSVHQWLVELQHADALADVGLPPRRMALFAGPPGCGKTTLAHHISARLGLVLVDIPAHRISDAFMNGTGKNIGTLFRAAASCSDQIVLFLDEIDSIGGSRTGGSTGAEKERNSILVSLMSEIDHYKGMLIAATNVPRSLDPALWRRFEAHIDIGLPDQDAQFAIVARYLSPFNLPDEGIDAICEMTAGVAPSLLRQVCEAVKRDLVLGPLFERDMSAAAVLGRVAAATKPHGGVLPALWASEIIRHNLASAMPWPPVRAGAA